MKFYYFLIPFILLMFSCKKTPSLQGTWVIMNNINGASLLHFNEDSFSALTFEKIDFELTDKTIQGSYQKKNKILILHSENSSDTFELRWIHDHEINLVNANRNITYKRIEQKTELENVSFKNKVYHFENIYRTDTLEFLSDSTYYICRSEPEIQQFKVYHFQNQSFLTFDKRNPTFYRLTNFTDSELYLETYTVNSYSTIMKQIAPNNIAYNFEGTWLGTHKIDNKYFDADRAYIEKFNSPEIYTFHLDTFTETKNAVSKTYTYHQTLHKDYLYFNEIDVFVAFKRIDENGFCFLKVINCINHEMCYFRMKEEE